MVNNFFQLFLCLKVSTGKCRERKPLEVLVRLTSVTLTSLQLDVVQLPFQPYYIRKWGNTVGSLNLSFSFVCVFFRMKPMLLN